MLARIVQPVPPFFILGLAAFLRFYHLSNQSLWSDEGNSVALARRSFIEIAQRTAFDIHPPLYYWLLKIWTFVLGDSEFGLRSLSVCLAILLVYVIGVLGTRFYSPRVGLIAAAIAALSAFQTYYAQEARMYILLTLLASLTILITFLLFTELGLLNVPHTFHPLSFSYIIIVTAGLYTHYAYPLILVVANLAFLGWLWENRAQTKKNFIAALHWVYLQIIPLLFYLPWLPTAWRQVTTWPSENLVVPLHTILAEISTTLIFGHSWPYQTGFILAISLVALILLNILGGIRQPETKTTPYFVHFTIILWLLLPLLLTARIFSPAFLKFLLIASPPFCLLYAVLVDRAIFLTGRVAGAKHTKFLPYLAGATLLIALLYPSTLAIQHYYDNPDFSRDDYRGIVAHIKALGTAEDAVILNAEGQQDVFNYYYSRTPHLLAPIYPLPTQRPLGETETLATLTEIAQTSEQIYAVYWANHQADPTGLIESWLDTQLFKATDQWYGNVRLVSYASPADQQQDFEAVDFQLGEYIELTGYALNTNEITPGDIAQINLQWETTAPLTENYTVFLQILDSANHVVGQRDARPLMETTSWPAGEIIEDTHGVFLEPGTPPGLHRLIMGLYNSQTGQRLPVIENGEVVGDFITLAEVNVVKPEPALPQDALRIQVPRRTEMFDVDLLGYDFYKVGHRSTPDTPLHPGDPVRLVLYWRAVQPVYWLEDKLFIQVLTRGGQSTPLSITRTPAGVDYPIDQWQPDEIVRAQYDFFLSNLAPGRYQLAFTLIDSVSAQPITALSEPFQIVE